MLACFVYLLCLCEIPLPYVIFISKKNPTVPVKNTWSIKFSSNSTSLQKSSFKSITATGRTDILLPNSCRGVTLSFSCCERQLKYSPAVQAEAPITHTGLPIQCTGLIWKCWWCCFTTWRLRSSQRAVLLALQCWLGAGQPHAAEPSRSAVSPAFCCVCIVAHCMVL